MGLSLGHLLLVLIIVLVLFGAGRIPRVMSDLGKGIRNLREELNKDHAPEEKPKAKPKRAKK